MKYNISYIAYSILYFNFISSPPIAISFSSLLLAFIQASSTIVRTKMRETRSTYKISDERFTYPTCTYKDHILRVPNE